MKKLVALLAATLSGALTLTAATPVAVWDGDFSVTQTGFTLDRSGNAISQDNSTITIDQDVGVKVDFTTGFADAMTVMFKYSDLSFDAQKTIATSFCSGGDENRTGVYLASGGTANGIWNTADWGNPLGTLSASSGVLAFYYVKSSGTGLYYISDAGVRTQIYFKDNLKAGNDTAINGCAIGGERAKAGATLLSAATGMKITGIAIFDSGLTEAEMANYAWPSETREISIDDDTTVSAINLQAGAANGVDLTIADGVTITYDTNFSASSVKLISSGSIALSAKAPPGNAELVKLDCSGVSGALIRTWLNPGVVGYNFRNNSGGDTAGQLATGGTWFISANSANGTDAGLFADGLTELSWSASGTYTSGVGSSITTGYLDDNSSQSPVIKLSAVPYATYDVVIYCSTDSDNFKFSAKEVNGTLYTWNGSQTVTTADENAAWGQSKSATIVEGTNALRVNGLSGALTIKGGKYSNNGTLKCRSCIAAIQIMPAGVSSGKSEIVIDATEGWTTTDSDMLGNIRTTYRNVRVLGSGQNGATLDFGYLNDATMYISSHIVFDGGKHAVTINGANDCTIGNNASEPILEVLDNTTLDLYQHDLSGWLGSAAAKVPTCKIQVDDGGQLNIRLNGAGTTYYQGRYTICPGAVITSYVTTSGDGNSHLRFNGGAVKGAEQIYVPATQAVEPGVATFNGADGNTGIFLASDVTAGLGVFVGDNSTLEFNLDIAGVAGAPLAKWGDGTLNLNGDLSGYQGTLAIHEGTVFVSTDTTLGSVTVDEGATLAYSYDAQPTITFGSVEGMIVVDVASLVSGGVIESGTYQIAPAGIPSYRFAVTGLPENSGFSVYTTVDGSIVLSDQAVFSPEWTGASGTWSGSQFNGKTGSTDGLDVSFSQGTTPLGEVTVAVDGEKSVNSASFVAKDTEYTLTGDKITADNGVVVGSAAPVRFYNAIDGAVTINAGSELTLAGDGAALQNGQLSGSGTLVLDPGEGKTYTMSPANTLFTGEAVIASGTVKMGDATSFGPMGRSSVIRVKGGATLDTNGAANGEYGKEKNMVVLEDGAKFTSTVANSSDFRDVPCTAITLEGNAIVDASIVAVGLAQGWDYNSAHLDVSSNTLQKIGSFDFRLSAIDNISGTGVLDIRNGSVSICNSIYGNHSARMSDGTVRVASGSYFKMVNVNNCHPTFSVKNLELNGAVTRDSTDSTLTVTGYITGNGTTPMLTLGANAIFKPTGTGYLKITESLTLPTTTDGEEENAEEVPYMVIDLTDALASGTTAIPLFKVGSAENLPDAENIGFVYPGQEVPSQVLPKGWTLSKTSGGRGYKLSKGNFSIRLR